MVIEKGDPKESQAPEPFASSGLERKLTATSEYDHNPHRLPPQHSLAIELPDLKSSYDRYDDVEYDHRKPWTRYPMGYPRFAAFIANDEDRSTTIFRRFQRLSSRNLLYLESELAYLEAEQDRLDQESRKSHELTLSMKSWNLLCLQATPPREESKTRETEEDTQRRLQLEEAAQERLQLAWRIREVLATYHEPAPTLSSLHRKLTWKLCRRSVETRERNSGVE